MSDLAQAIPMSESASLAVRLIPTLPFLSMLVCGLFACSKREGVRKLAAPVTILAIVGAFVCSLNVSAGLTEISASGAGSAVVHYFDWIQVGSFTADFSFFVDPLTVVMLFVVTGIGSLIAIYASGYMAGDVGYARFFAYISLFIFAMTCLVLGDNLLMLFLGWEGVGAASYLLIGFYYRKPSAVAAAKKAFIVNRVGDFGFALGLMATFVVFGTIQFAEFLPATKVALGQADLGSLTHGAQVAYDHANQQYGLAGDKTTLLLAIPFLLMLGAFGKSAQLPLHVWLPDAMEGPTPVSALIHAATMVTAGVYMIARLILLFQLNPAALATVATVGGVTACFAATIALCQYDIKRIWAYSTLSQLGYMFLGVGVLSTYGAVFHLYTHAFFKALLFLTAGSVMHALAGQLDLRKMSGLRHKMPVTCWLMFTGCLALAGVPFIASGYYSKDVILIEAMIHCPWLGWLGVATALLTAFYTFRLWFRVFWGPEQYEMGHEHHGYEVKSHAGDHHNHDGHHHHAPHEMPWLMNAPLILLAVGALLAGVASQGWMQQMIGASTAGVTESTVIAANEHIADVAAYEHHEHAAHAAVFYVAGLGSLVMIGLAFYFHLYRREAADAVARKFPRVVSLLHNKYYIDEIYDAMFRLPLRMVGHIAYQIDRFIVDGLIVNVLIGHAPRWLGWAQRPFQSGSLQGYGLTMAVGLAVIVFLIAWKVVNP